MLRAQNKRSINTSLLLLLLLKNSGGARLFLGLRVKIYVGVFRLECSSLCCVARQYVSQWVVKPLLCCKTVCICVWSNLCCVARQYGSACGQTFVVLQDSMDVCGQTFVVLQDRMDMCVVEPLLCCKTVWICVWSNLFSYRQQDQSLCRKLEIRNSTTKKLL